MKKVYNMGEDLFLAIAFVTLTIGGVLKLIGINEVFLGITSRNLILLAVVSLLFSITLSMSDIAHGRK
jgi:hypothetical protein